MSEKTMTASRTFDPARFIEAVSKVADARGVKMRGVAKATGVSTTTLSRMKQGRQPDAASLVALSSWAGLDARSFTETSQPEPVFSAEQFLVSLCALVRAEAEGNEEIKEIARKDLRKQMRPLERLVNSQ